LAAAGIKVAAEGVKIQGEGTAGAASAADVQKSIDADTKGFAEAATKLVAMSDEIVAATTAHDAMKTDDAQGRLTDVCGECHKKFWYPNQPQ
jgi:cytochrome c556